MEYQDYNYQGFEQLEEKVEQAQEKLNSAQKELREAGVAELQGALESNLYGLALEQDRQKCEAREEMKWATKEVKLAEKELKAVGSDDLREALERAAFIKLAEENFQSAQRRLNEYRKFFENAELRGNVLDLRGGLTVATTRLRQHKILLKWMERQ